ncbi:MAG: IclR family transcriptional regulator [Lachnospiraceae bacterium]
MNKNYKASHVQSVSRALELLNLIAEKNYPLSLTEMAGLLDWPKSTVHGLISTLRDYDYATQSEEDGKYYLGVRFFELGNMLQSSWDIHNAARPVMVKLNARFNETIHLATEEKGEVLYLEKIDSNHLFRIVSKVGTRLPMYCTGLGKVMLAYRPIGEVRKILQKQPMQTYTSRTITTISTMERELKEIREKGYALDNGEIMDSLRCVAAPIYDENGEVRYALSISGLYSSISENSEAIIKELLIACDTISAEMGYRAK